MLNPLALVFIEVFLNLRLAGGRFVDRDAHLAIRAGHGPGMETGFRALDIEISNFAKIEQALVESGPLVHVAGVHVVGQVIDKRETQTGRVGVGAVYGLILIRIDRLLAVFVDQVKNTAADPLDAGNIQCKGCGLCLERLRTFFQRCLEYEIGVLDAHRKTAGTGAMDRGKILGKTARLVIEQENAVALLVQGDVFAAMPGHGAKAELGEQLFQNRGIGRGKFHKLEPIDAHRIIELLSHLPLLPNNRSPDRQHAHRRSCLCAGSGLN